MLPSLEIEKRAYLSSPHDKYVYDAWRGYEYLFTPDMQPFESKLTPTVVGVIHPGWHIYTYERDPTEKYEIYLANRDRVITRAIKEGNAVLAWVPADARLASIKNMGMSVLNRHVILLPNGPGGDGCTLTSEVLGSDAESRFWLSMRRRVERIVLMGEYWDGDGGGCVGEIVKRCRQHIPDVEVIDEATYAYEPHD